MATGVQSWSKTASSNATADSAAPWPEGMAPSQVNDSARGGMASVAKYRDDTAGTLLTSGSSTAYTVSSNQVFQTLASGDATKTPLDGARLSIKFHATSGAAPTLSVDGLTAQPIQTVVGTAVPAGFFVANSIWTVVYDNANSSFVVHDVMNVISANINDKAVTLQKIYHPTRQSVLLGTDSNPALTITGASNNGAGLIRLNVASTSTFATGQVKTVSDVVGTTEANGTWTITVVSSTAIDLQGSTFTNAYVSGGTIGGGIEEISMGGGMSIVGSALTASIPIEPQGYLTLTSGTPIILGDVASATTVYYTPYKGNLINIYNGSSFPLTTFAELSLSLTSSQAANTIYDLFVINDSGTLRLVTGPAWASSTAGSCSRGTGASTTELQRLNGIWTNKQAITGTYGVNTVSIAANRGTYVGSIFIDGSAGHVTCHRSYGQSRKWGLWNAYNRESVTVLVGDSTSSWTYQLSAIRASNGDASNNGIVLCGLPEEEVTAMFVQQIGTANITGNPAIMNIGIGLNSTTAFTQVVGSIMAGSDPNIAGIGRGTWSVTGKAVIAPSLGINQFYCCEQSPSSRGTNGNIFNGSNTNMELAINWRA
ncbi:MAG: hypothetical protein J0G33_02630 [Afipia felis]|nr:hypothetical protein [Afipia felis]